MYTVDRQTGRQSVSRRSPTRRATHKAAAAHTKPARPVGNIQPVSWPGIPPSLLLSHDASIHLFTSCKGWNHPSGLLPLCTTPTNTVIRIPSRWSYRLCTALTWCVRARKDSHGLPCGIIRRCCCCVCSGYRNLPCFVGVVWWLWLGGTNKHGSTCTNTSMIHPG